jgi:formylglycine-generating enzyme required for sulfatase activity
VGCLGGGVPPWGPHDLAGNALEWVADWFDAAYYQRSPNRNPPGPESGQYRVLRGGSWNSLNLNNLRTTDRKYSPPNRVDYDVGFRCARGS